MTAPSSGYLVRSTDFPDGIKTQSDVQKLGALLNPYLVKLSSLGQAGVNVGQNLDGQIVTFSVTTPATMPAAVYPVVAGNVSIPYSVAPALSCFPLRVRIADRRQPAAVWLLSIRDHAQANPVGTPNSGSTTPAIQCPGLQWSYVGSAPGAPNFASVDGMPGLALGRTYDVAVLVLYS